jgi:hypothetical protein
MKTKKVNYETKFNNGQKITPFESCGTIEGFCERSAPEDTIKAISFIAGTGLYRSLQGFYGRTVRDMVERGLMNWNGIVNWDEVNCLIENNENN